MSTILRPGRVALDTRKIRCRASVLCLSPGHVGSAVAVLSRARGMDVNPPGEIHRLRLATRDNKALIVGKGKAQLYALALNVELAELEDARAALPAPFEQGR